MRKQKRYRTVAVQVITGKQDKGYPQTKISGRYESIAVNIPEA